MLLYMWLLRSQTIVNLETDFSVMLARDWSSDWHCRIVASQRKQFVSCSVLQDFANIMKMLRSLIQDGYTALLEQRCRSAAQSFSELLNGLDPQKVKVGLPSPNSSAMLMAPDAGAGESGLSPHCYQCTFCLTETAWISSGRPGSEEQGARWPSLHACAHRATPSLLSSWCP